MDKTEGCGDMSHWDNKRFLSFYHGCKNRQRRGTLSEKVNCMEFARREYEKVLEKQAKLLEEKRRERELYRQHPDFNTFRHLLALAKDEPEETQTIILSPDNASDKSQDHPKVSIRVKKKNEEEAIDLW